MGTLAEAVLSALRGFATEVGTWTNQGTLVSIEGHIAQIKNAVDEDLHAGETAAKAVLADLYRAFHGAAPAPQTTEAPAEPAPAAPATGGVISASAAPVLVDESGPELVVPPAAPTASPVVAVDPTPAPSTTEGSSAPSSTPSASTTDTAAAAPAPAAAEIPPAVAQ